MGKQHDQGQSGDDAQADQDDARIDENHRGLLVGNVPEVFPVFGQQVEEGALLLGDGETHAHSAQLHAVVGIGDDRGLLRIPRIIGDGRLRLLEGDGPREDDEVIPVQGQEGLGAAEDVVAAVEQPGIVDIIFGF